MEKFVVALCLPKESDNIDVGKVRGVMLNSFSGKKSKANDVVIIDLNNTSSEAINKFIDMGGIDCFAFTPDTLLEEGSKDILSRVLKADKEIGKSTNFLNVYNGRSDENIEKSIAIGDKLLEDKYHTTITHMDICQQDKLFIQNLMGMKNQALRTRKLLMEKEDDVLDLTRRIVDDIEKDKDQYTAKHIKSVCMIAEKIADDMGLSEQEIETLKIGALLHDVGKKDVSDAVLKKPERLTDEEFLEMRSHVSFGEIELNQYNLGEYERAKIVAAEHHERFDGKGYPRGLEGKDIDSLARIASVADAAQAMFGRSYQKGKTKDELIEQLEKGSGTQFDPEVVGVLINILDKEPQSIGVSYNEDGVISYDVKDTYDIIARDEDETSEFVKGLKENVKEEYYGADKGKEEEPEELKSKSDKKIDENSDIVI